MSVLRRFASVLAFVAVASMALARTDQNSFLNRPANTLPELLSQVKSDPQVASRFMRHFGMSKDEILQMFSKLKLGRIPADGVYLVYNVPNWEEVRARALMFRKGTLVWQDEQGNPVLKTKCANPMVRGTDIGVASAVVGVDANPHLEVRDLVAVKQPETAFIETPPGMLEPMPTQVNALEVMPVPPTVPTVGRVPAPPLILPVMAGLLLGLNKGDSPPVPEPSSMIILGGAAMAFIAKRRAKK